MTTRSITRLYDGALAEAGLRATGYAVLSRLSADGPLTVTGLAERLAMDRTTCSRELDPLVRAGLVEVRVGQDRRQRVVRLLPKGAKRLAKGRPYWEAVQERVATAFGSQHTEDLLAQLRDLLSESNHLQVH